MRASAQATKVLPRPPRPRLMDYETTALIRETAKTAAHETVEETLLKLGMNSKDPIKMQRQMMMLEELGTLVQDPDFKNDMMALRQFAATLRRVKTHGLLTIVGLIIIGLGAAAWIGLKAKMNG